MATVSRAAILRFAIRTWPETCRELGVSPWSLGSALGLVQLLWTLRRKRD